MRPRSLVLALDHALALVGAAAVALSPISPTYPLLVIGAGAVGLWWDLRRTHFIPRWLWTALGAAGFLVSLLPFSPETLAEQSLAAMTVLLAIKLLEPKEDRDHLQILALSLILVAGAASLTPEMVFAGLLLAVMVLGIMLLLWLPFAGRMTLADRPLLTTLARIAAGMSAATIPLTVFFFLILPRTMNPFWQGISPSPAGVSGFSNELSLGQISRLSVSGATAFRVEMEEPRGRLPETPYWRGAVLERTDGRTWTPLPATASFGVGRGGAVRAVYYLEPHGERELFLLEQPLTAVATFRFLPMETGRVPRFPTPLRRAIRYTGYSNPGPSRAERITPAERDRNLQLPEDLPPRIRELASRLAGGADDPSVKARLLAEHFATGFTYSLAIPAASGANPVEAFLFDHRTGYCEYFASALCLLLRASGVPARVVVGYLGGEYSESGNYYLVRQSEAHSWVEAHLGESWVRFDPTPASESGFTLASTRAGRPRLWLDVLRMRWNAWVVQFDTENQAGVLRSTRAGMRGLFSPGRPGKNTVALLAAIGAGVLAILLRRRLGKRPADPVARLAATYDRIMAARGLGRHPWEGPADHAARARSAWPAAADPIERLSGAWCRHRYRGDAIGREELAELSRALRALRRLR
jgi:transglutaminase-like putative cysteine protease